MNGNPLASSGDFPGRVLVVGLGISGQAVCELLLKRGTRVRATDMRDRAAFGGALDALEDLGCRFRLGEHVLEDFLEVDQIIVSPGVPLDLEPLRAASAGGVEIVGELEWAWRHVQIPVVAVTGTNGKTTVTSLLGEVLRKAGKRVFVGGNIGTPLSRWLLSGEPADVMVLEVSSFQLDTAARFRPDVGVLLNITEDHLDRYDDFQAYVESKFSIFSRQTASQTAVVNLDDPVCRRELPRSLPGELLVYSRSESAAHARIEGDQAVVRLPGRASFEINLARTPLKGVHNQENILATLLAAGSMGVSPKVLQSVLDGFRGLPHRVEWVRTWHGIDFFDDSKGTNVGAVVKALESFDRPVLILLGGRDKLGSYEPLGRALQGRGKGAFVFGEAAQRLHKDLSRWLPTQSFSGLEPALAEAVRQGEPGDVVLLSPACSSFDQYTGYAERGDHFKRLVRELGD